MSPARSKNSTANKNRILRRLLIAMLAAIIFSVIYIYRDYIARPGILDSSTIHATDRGNDYITIEWDDVRNTESYALYYKPKEAGNKEWRRIDINSDTTEALSATIDGLEEGTEYCFILRPDSEDRTGFSTDEVVFATRMPQTIEIAKTTYTKLTSSKKFLIDARAETPLTYISEDETIAKVDPESGKVTIKGEGNVTINISAAENDEYSAAEGEVSIHVIAAEPTSASGAALRVIYHLDQNNCEAIKSVIGSGSVQVPQGLAYTGDKYIISYGSASSQRIISFDIEGDGKSVSNPSIDLGHPNGFTYSDLTGLCYCVKGWTGRCVTYSPESGAYGTITLPYGCSGIGYDRDKKLMYTSSRTAMLAYSVENGFAVYNRTGVVKHGGKVYTQDCGGHAGIMMHCLSGSSKHGTNYIDLYDMINERYLGTISCDLSEVESCIVDDEGYLEILANTSAKTDYIWKTDINIEDIGEGL